MPLVAIEEQERNGGLLGRSVVAEPPLHFEIWDTCWFIHFHLNSAVLPISSVVLWRICQNILVAQLDPNPHGNIGQVVGIRCAERPPSSRLCELREQARPGAFLLGQTRKNRR